MPYDNNGQYFYIKDGADVWNPGWQPVKRTLDSYECRHGLGYSRFTGSLNQVSAQVLSFVPLNDSCEVSRLVLTNNGSAAKELSLFSYVEWCLWNADDDMKNFQRNLSIGEMEIEAPPFIIKQSTESAATIMRFIPSTVRWMVLTPAGTPSWAPTEAPPIRRLS